ncbi:MAG: hypothetical protein JWM14_200 [Chitinophagaceae bacterium]|nr:hypothetical protein [Chitinophagaceae bacterium]
MKKFIHFITVCFFCISTTALAQNYSDDLYWSISKLRGDSLRIGFKDKGSVQLKGLYNYNSTAVTNDFFSKLVYKSTYISEEDKQGSINRLKAHNRLGVDLSASLQGTYRSKKDTTVLFDMGVAYRDFTYAYFTKDIFKLAFEGNSQYAGQNAVVGPSTLKEWNYASLFVGVQKVVCKELIVGARLSFIKAGFYRETTMGAGNLYTDPNGAYVELSAPFHWYSQQRPDNPFAANNGWGAGVDLYAQRFFKKSILSFEVRDLGAVNWRNMNTYTGDKTYHYEGQNIGDILAPGNSYISSVALDSVAKQLGIEKVVQNKTTMLPTRLQVSYLYKLNTKWAVKGDLNYMFLKGYLPYAKVSAYYAITPALCVVPAITVGGYGSINTQIGLSATVAKTWSLQANVFALEYLAAPTSYSGHGLELYLTKRF